MRIYEQEVKQLERVIDITAYPDMPVRIKTTQDIYLYDSHQRQYKSPITGKTAILIRGERYVISNDK